MSWSLAADGFYDYTPTVSFGGKTTRIYYVAEKRPNGTTADNTTGAANDINNPFRTVPRARKFTVTAANATRGALYQNITSYDFTVSGITVTPTAGATYTNNGITFTVTSASISAGAGTVTCTAAGGGVETATSTLVKTSGTGDANISYTGAASHSGPHYYVVDTIAGGTSLLGIDNAPGTTPNSGAVLTKRSGTGDALISYTGTGTQQDGALRQWNIDRGGSGGSTSFNFPDWFLFRMGDSFERQNFETQIGDGSSNPMGPDYTEPYLIGVYDPSITQTTGWGTFCPPNPAASALARPKTTTNPNTSGEPTFLRIIQGGGGVSTRYGLTDGGNNIVVVGLEGDAQGGQTFTWTQQPVSFFRVEDCKVYNYGVPINGGTEFVRLVMTANGQHAEGNGPELATYDINSLGTLYKWKECIFDQDTSGGGLSHTIYGGSDSGPSFGYDPGPMVSEGCLYTRSAEGDLQIRAGGRHYNNSHIHNGISISAWGGTGPRADVVSYNVAINMISRPLGSAPGQFLAGMNTSYYLSNWMNQATSVTVEKNIVCHELGPMTEAIEIPDACRNWTVQNNIFYKICNVAGNAATISVRGNAGVISHKMTITNAGSGYTNKTFDVAQMQILTGTVQGSTKVRTAYVGLSTTTGWPWQAGDHAREGTAVLGGFTGAFAVLNGRKTRVYFGDNTGTSGLSNVVQLQGNFPELDDGAGGSLTYVNATHAGKLYLPYGGRLFSGGTGRFFRADVLVYNGQVAFVHGGSFWDDSAASLGISQPGAGYSVNDSLLLTGTAYTFAISAGSPVPGNTYTNNGQSFVYQGSDGNTCFIGTGAPTANGTLSNVGGNLTFTSATQRVDVGGVNICTLPGGSGFTLRVDEVGTYSGLYNTNGNISDKDGTGAIGTNPATYPYPERDAGTYYNEVILGAGIGAGAGGHTYADFCNAALGQRRQNWNPLLMAESFNDYIREGLGQAMVGSAYADLGGGGPPPTQILMPQICM